MNYKMLWTIIAGLTLLAPLSTAQTLLPPPISSYAEGLYSDYSIATGGAITFTVQTVQTGAMTDLSGAPFSNLVSAPPYVIETDFSGTSLANPSYIIPSDPGYGRTDLSGTVNNFGSNTNPLPLAAGAYRKLSVTSNINGDIRPHDALEFCWASLNQCAVLDPVVVFLESKIDTLLGLIASGYSVQSVETLSTSEDVTAAGRCGLASHPNDIGLTLTWPPYTVTAKDIYGLTLWKLSLAQQVVGITCDRSCLPQPFTISSASSSFGNVGYHTAHGNRGATGVTSNRARSIAETKCTEDFLGTVKASASVKGTGASINLSWDLAGSAYSNGGVYSDACARF
jgi:hypothetical protein